MQAMTRWMPTLLRRRLVRGEAGYVAVTVAISLTVLLGFCAFAVDVGNWYYVGQRAQRAADAAALAGVPALPNDPTSAFAVARAQATKNSYTDNATTTVTPALDGRPTRLRVTVKTTVKNQFGWLLGVPQTTISRTAVADYAGPVPMGSPCNEFGNDPEPGSNRGSTCDNLAGSLWANVNGASADKQNGDGFQSLSCNTSAAGHDGCTGSTNDEYDKNGYYYSVNVQQAGMSSLTIQLFDPVWVNVGLQCSSNLSNATTARNPWVTTSSDANARYQADDTPYCTGDNQYSGSEVQNTQFTVRDPSGNTWDPLTYPVHAGCQKTYAGYSGSVLNAVNQASGGYRADIAEGFRRWVTLCTIPNPLKGDYLVQVKSSNYTGANLNADSGNRFAIRAYGDNNDKISVSGRERMGIYSNKPGTTTEFYLARVQSGAAGQNLKLNLYDVGDSDKTGTIKIVSPGGGDYAGCTGSGVTTSIASDCSFSVTAGSPSVFNGRIQVINIPVPPGYTCVDADNTACWVKLRYTYGSGSKPTDVTTWSANIEGDPVRLVE
jgi:Flp pilus assembly protein TadG